MPNSNYDYDYDYEEEYIPPQRKTTTKKKRKKKKKKSNLTLKYILLAICLIVLVFLIAKCAKGNDEKDKNKETNTSAETTEEITTEVPPPTYEELLNGISDKLQSPTVFVYDIEAEAFLFEKNTKKSIHPGSMSVLWTSLYACTVIDPSTEITVTSEVLSIVPSGTARSNIYKNQRLTLEMLIESMMVGSGCDCSYVVAVEVGRTVAHNPELTPTEAVDMFLIGINEWLREAGYTGTKLSDPYGLSENDHYTTARDLTNVAINATTYKVLSKYITLPTVTVFYASGQKATWNSKNLTLYPDSEYYCPLATGVKAGAADVDSSTTQNHLLSACAIENGGKSRFIIGTMGSTDKNVRFADAKLIIDTLTTAKTK